MNSIPFHFIKSVHYVEVPVHGAFGGVTPTGDGIFMAVFSERLAIPKTIVHPVSDANELQPEDRSARDAKEGIVRTVHAGMHMSIAQATALRQWLDEKLVEHAQLTAGDSDNG